MNDFIEYEGSKLFYYKYGEGLKSILLFHGYGQDHAAFESWIDILKTDYTIYSFDLFLHGQSTWAERPLEKADWKNVVELLLQKEKINEFELAGFSMGGKFAFATLEAFPEKTKRMTLVAPDGIKVNFWYRLATYPVAMRWLFERFVSNPKTFFSLAKFLQAVGIIDKYLLRFVMLQMDTEEKRKRVYSTWIYFRHLKFEMKSIAELLIKEKTPLKIIVGRFDKVIPVKDMQRLLKHVPHGQLQVLEAGHNQLIDAAKDVIK
jgi:pimeloyl-ACP methyl ester carboxylesterase